jgi:hypothetical protein
MTARGAGQVDGLIPKGGTPLEDLPARFDRGGSEPDDHVLDFPFIALPECNGRIRSHLYESHFSNN